MNYQLHNFNGAHSYLLSFSMLVFFLSEMRPSFAFRSSSSGLGATSRSALLGQVHMSSLTEGDLHQQTLSVAPMMAHTNRHFRTFWRLISRKSVLYTEMVVAEQIVNAHSKSYLQPLNKHLGHNPEVENPLVLQLGGNDPELLSKASTIAYSSGFQSINLNCGCPSNTVASTNSMGASMMYTPERTAQCCDAIISAGRNYLVENFQNPYSKINSPDVNFSVKCRTGVDDLDSYDDLHNFVKIVSSQGGVKRFQIHARKALLGVSTMANRDIPPLQYARVYKLVDDFPDLEFEINGAISSPTEVENHLSTNRRLKGAMVGRACINHPYMWINTDQTMYKNNGNSNKNDKHDNNNDNSNDNNNNKNNHNDIPFTRGEIIEKYANYCETVEREEASKGLSKDTGKTSSKIMLAPVYNLFTGEEYCEKFRRDLKKMSLHVTSPSLILRSAVKQIPIEVLHGRRGEYRENDEIMVYEKMKKSSGPMKSRIS